MTERPRIGLVLAGGGARGALGSRRCPQGENRQRDDRRLDDAVAHHQEIIGPGGRLTRGQRVRVVQTSCAATRSRNAANSVLRTSSGRDVAKAAPAATPSTEKSSDEADQP